MKSFVASLMAVGLLFSASAQAEPIDWNKLAQRIAHIQESNLALRAGTSLFQMGTVTAGSHLGVYVVNKMGIRLAPDATDYLIKTSLFFFKAGSIAYGVGILAQMVIEVSTFGAANSGTLADAYATSPEGFMDFLKLPSDLQMSLLKHSAKLRSAVEEIDWDINMANAMPVPISQ